MTTAERSFSVARITLAVTTLGFLVVGDIHLAPVAFWARFRLALLIPALLAAGWLILTRQVDWRTILRAPLVFFTLFCAVGVVSALAADTPLAALRYACGYIAIELMAVAIASTFSERVILRGLLATLLAKVVISVSLVYIPWAWWEAERLKGIYGSANPMGATAGLAYLLLVLHAWHDWPGRGGRWLLVLAACLATLVLGATRSLSAFVATGATFALVAWPAYRENAGSRERRDWSVISLAVLAPIAVTILTQPPRRSSAAQAMTYRSDWWTLLQAAILNRPWLGYGPGATPTLHIDGSPFWARSAHDLYLEATLYAGIPAACLMAIFMATATLMALRRAWQWRTQADVWAIGTAAVIAVYAALSFVEPVVLNGTPSSLVAPLVMAAVCSRRGDGR